MFDEALGNSGYRVAAVTVEKVLVGRCDDLPLPATGTRVSGKAPYDAMVWLVLGKAERRRASDGEDVVQLQEKLMSKRSAQARALK